MVQKKLWASAKKVGVLFPITVVCGMLVGVLTIAQAWLFSRVVVRVASDGLGLYAVRSTLLLLLAVLVLRSLVTAGEEHCALKLSQAVRGELTREVTAKLEAIGPFRLAEEQSGTLLTLLTEGIASLDAYFRHYLPQLFRCAVVPILFLVVAFPTDWLSGLIMLLTAPLIPMFMMLIGKWTKSVTTKRWKVLARMSGYLQDVLRGMETLKLLGQGEKQGKRIDAIGEEFRSTNMAVLRIAFLSALTLELVTTLSIAVVAVGLGVRLVAGGVGFEKALFLILLAPDFYQPFRGLGVQFHNSLNGVEVAKTIDRFMQLPEQPLHEGEKIEGKIKPPALFLKQVHFCYDKDRQALDECTLQIKAGQTVALVGESGGGKSTILHLLSAFLQPERGEVCVNDRPLGEFCAADWRRQVALVPQHPYIFSASVRQNLLLGEVQATDEQIWEACRVLGADRFLSALPEGLDTKIGAGGRALSGGQTQLIALLRAYLKDAPVLLCDEATQGLDALSEGLITRAMQTVFEGRTVVISAHRLATVRRADWVAVVGKGKVIEQGKPSDLAQQEGAFAALLREGRALWKPTLPKTQAQSEPTSAEQTLLAHNTPDTPAVNPKTSRRFLLDLVRPQLGQMLLAALVGACTVLCNMGLLGTSAVLISWAAQMPPILWLMPLIVGVRFFGISRAVFRYIERLITHDITFRILTRLRGWYYRQVLPLAPAIFGRRSIGQLFNHILSDIEILKFFYLRVLAAPLVAVVVLVVTAGFLMCYVPYAALTLAVGYLLCGLGLPLWVRRYARRHLQGKGKEQGLWDTLLIDYLHGLKELQSAPGATDKQRTALEQQRARVAYKEYAAAQLDNRLAVANAGIAHLVLWLTLVLSIPAVQTGVLSGMYLAMVALVASAAFEAVQPLPMAVAYYDESMQAMEEMLTLTGIAPRGREQAAVVDHVENGAVCFEHVTFAYQQGQPAAVRDLSLSIGQGEHWAMVGASGAGKSSVAQLLLGFYRQDSGQIVVGGHNADDLSCAVLCQTIGMLSQKPYLFAATIRENLLLAAPEAHESDLWQALDKASLRTFVEQLPLGLDTVLEEGGQSLSGGQRQRLALARLFLQAPKIVLVDEALQGLDNTTAREIHKALLAFCKDKTLLEITHNLTFLGEMDRVAVLKDGELIGCDTPDALVQTCPYFAALCRAEQDHF